MVLQSRSNLLVEWSPWLCGEVGDTTGGQKYSIDPLRPSNTFQRHAKVKSQMALSDNSTKAQFFFATGASDVRQGVHNQLV